MIIIFMVNIYFWLYVIFVYATKILYKKIVQDDKIVKSRGGLYVVNKKKNWKKYCQGWIYYLIYIIGFCLLAFILILGLVFLLFSWLFFLSTIINSKVAIN